MAARIKRQNKAASDNVIWIDVTAATALIAIGPSVRRSVRPRPYVRLGGEFDDVPAIRMCAGIMMNMLQQHTARSGE